MDALAQYDYRPMSFHGTIGQGQDQAQYIEYPKSQYAAPSSLESIQSVHNNGNSPSSSSGLTSNNIPKSRPCDACRRRKSRCVLKDGTVRCVLCDFHNQNCTYVQTPLARKRKSVSISQDEEVIVSSKRESSSAVGVHDRLLLRRDSSSQQQQQQHATNPKMDQLIDDYANLKGPSLLKRTLGLQRRKHGIYQGPSGCFEPALIREEPGNASTGDPQFLRIHVHDRFLLLPDEATDHYDDELADIDAIEAIIAPHGRALINLYFRIVHPSFPILHKKVFLEKYSRTHQEFSPPLLAAVYILALQYWSYDNKLSRFKKPELENLVALAMTSLAYVVHRPKLSTVEAGLLLLQWRTGTSSWTLTAQMVAVGQELGLHRDCTAWNIPAWERGLRKRLAWALFMQDKWSALIHGRPSHILRDDWTVQPLIAERDFPENAADDDEREGSTDVEKGRGIFCHMVSLTQILADVLLAFHSGMAEREIRAAGKTDATKLVLSRAKPLQIRLNAWHAGLPDSLSMSNVTIRKLSSTGYLHLAFWATEISLHRCIFRTLPGCQDIELATICRNAATLRLSHTIAFVKGLKPEHLQSFWYFASAFNFALVGVFQSLLCASEEIQEDRNTQMALLDEYRWMLRVSSRSAGFLERSMEMIELYTGDLRGLVDVDGGQSKLLGDLLERSNDFQNDDRIVERSGSLLFVDDEEEAEPEAGEPDEANVSLMTNDTALAWYAQTPATEQMDHTLRHWESLDVDSPYHKK